jgi:hypothetical protein
MGFFERWLCTFLPEVHVAAGLIVVPAVRVAVDSRDNAAVDLLEFNLGIAIDSRGNGYEESEANYQEDRWISQQRR